MVESVFDRKLVSISAGLAALLLAGCASPMSVRAEGTHLGAVFVTSHSDARAIDSLRQQLIELSPTVRPDEAQRVAECAYSSARQLTRDYGVLGPPLFHNFLVNTGIRKRGLCYQWAEDLFACLDRLQLNSLELRWGEARAGTLREHNCVVVTAKGQSFGEGIVLDCWRHGGRLFVGHVATDHYPWKEDANYLQTAKAKAAAAHPRAFRNTDNRIAARDL
jgi:hypothetical protein